MGGVLGPYEQPSPLNIFFNPRSRARQFRNTLIKTMGVHVDHTQKKKKREGETSTSCPGECITQGKNHCCTFGPLTPMSIVYCDFFFLENEKAKNWPTTSS